MRHLRPKGATYSWAYSERDNANRVKFKGELTDKASADVRIHPIAEIQPLFSNYSHTHLSIPAMAWI